MLIALVGLCACFGLTACGQRSSRGPGASTSLAASTAGGVVAGQVVPTVPAGGGTIPSPATPSTQPRITPGQGTRHTTFIVHLTSRWVLGTRGARASEYRI